MAYDTPIVNRSCHERTRANEEYLAWLWHEVSQSKEVD